MTAELIMNCTCVRSGQRMRISYEDQHPDSKGRRLFFLDWLTDEGRRRGQIFRTVPAQQVLEDSTSANFPRTPNMNPADILIVNNTNVDLTWCDSALVKAAHAGELPEELADLFTLEITDGEFTWCGQTFKRRAVLNFV
jgi:hypothetical protein